MKGCKIKRLDEVGEKDEIIEIEGADGRTGDSRKQEGTTELTGYSRKEGGRDDRADRIQ